MTTITDAPAWTTTVILLGLVAFALCVTVLVARTANKRDREVR